MIQTQVSLPMFYLGIHWRKVSNAERVNWRQHIKGRHSVPREAQRTSEDASLRLLTKWEPGSLSGGVGQVGT